jgi:hypothetical protein
MRRRICAFCLHHGVKEQHLKRFFLLGADDRRVQQLSFLRSDKGASLLDDAGQAPFALRYAGQSREQRH